MRHPLRLSAILLFLAAAWLAVERASPQQPGMGSSGTPHLFQVFPCGGKQGTSFEVIVTGLDLDGATTLLFSEPGISAESLGPTAPPSGTAKQPKAGTSKSHKFRVSVGAAARLGTHDVRVVTRSGVSNPRAFVVGDLPEILEEEPNNNVDQMQRVPLDCTVHGVIATPTDVDYFVFAGKRASAWSSVASPPASTANCRPPSNCMA